MKHLKPLFLCLLLVSSLFPTALAIEVPDSIRTENLNGQQRVIKTYTLPVGADPEALKEKPIDYEGYRYTWAFTTKEEHPYQDSKDMVQTVTVETSKKDLSVILAELAPTISYDDGEYAGELTLDHTTITTEAASYTTGYSTVTETKVIGPLDRNDMSYIPATTVKNGKTLSLSNVEWQVLGTDLVGDSLVPSSYQAVATYSGKSSYSTATGYVTTAEYKGCVTSSGVSGITYTVVYTGVLIEPDPIEGTEPNNFFALLSSGAVLPILSGILLLVLAGPVAFLFLHRKNVYIYVPGDKPRDYKLIATFRADPQRPEVDITCLEPYPEGIIAVEIKRTLAKKLLGQTFTVHHRSADYAYTVLQDRPGDWHEFDPSEEKEEIT